MEQDQLVYRLACFRVVRLGRLDDPFDSNLYFILRIYNHGRPAVATVIAEGLQYIDFNVDTLAVSKPSAYVTLKK